MINREKLSYKYIYNILFCISKLLQVSMLDGALDVSPQGFYHVKTSVC
jgi:hypothetical protein